MITGASLTSTLGWVLALALLAGYAEPSRAQDAEPEVLHHHDNTRRRPSSKKRRDEKGCR